MCIVFCHEGHGQLKPQLTAGPLLNHTCLQADRRNGRTAFQQVIETVFIILMQQQTQNLTVTCTEHWKPNLPHPFSGEVGRKTLLQVSLAIFQVTLTCSMSENRGNSMELPYLLSHREIVETKSETSSLFPPRDNPFSCGVCHSNESS